MLPSAGDGYDDAHAHLLDEQRWINHLVSEYVAEMGQARAYHKFENFSGLYIAGDEIDAIINHPAFLNPSRPGGQDRPGPLMSETLRSRIDEKVQRTLDTGLVLPLYEIKRRFSLSAFEYQVFLLCLVCELDARYEKLYAYLQNDLTKKSPGVNLILDLLHVHSKERLHHLDVFYPDGVLRRLGLVTREEWSAENSIILQHFRTSLRLVSYVLNTDRAEQQLIPYMRHFSALDWEHVVIEAALRTRIETLFEIIAASGGARPQPVLFLYGRAGIGKKTIARALVRSLGMRLGVADLHLLIKNPKRFRENVRLVMREGVLRPCIVCFEHFEKLEEQHTADPELLSTFLHEIGASERTTILCSENPLPTELLDRAAFYSLEIPFPSYPDQRQLWAAHLHGYAAADEALVDHLTARYSLTGGQIARAACFARQAALVRDPQKGNPIAADLSKGARLSSQPRLSTLARKIEPAYRWDDLVLPADQLHLLKELTNQIKHKQHVMHTWGFASKLTLGQGLNALFAGPSGTGKTMSAEVIANDLELDLYKVNLATVVSKYIGETEKNLNRIFDEAEHSNAILFFDEADALFGKRSEVKDAHDRYSNIEIAFLLQRMEEYEGISILATNLRQNIDDAFTRRLRFVIDFPFPDEPYRRRIWQKIWPKNMPLDDDVDLTFMARQFEITGGNIRNIALTAAFYAADNSGSVNMKHVLQGTKRELQKMGKICIKEDFGMYQHLV